MSIINVKKHTTAEVDTPQLNRSSIYIKTDNTLAWKDDTDTERVAAIGGTSNSSVFLKTGLTINSTSSTVFTNISEHQISCISGKVYRFRAYMRILTSATGNGITFSMSGTAAGSVGALARIPTSRTATSLPSMIAFGQLMAVTGLTTTSPELAILEGLFVCTGTGTLYPQFRTENNGQLIQILDNSILEYNEL